MRKNETAKIKIKKKYGFGRKENVDKLKFPQGYEDENSEERKRLMTKGIIYEVKLLLIPHWRITPLRRRQRCFA